MDRAQGRPCRPLVWRRGSPHFTHEHREVERQLSDVLGAMQQGKGRVSQQPYSEALGAAQHPTLPLLRPGAACGCPGFPACRPVSCPRCER